MARIVSVDYNLNAAIAAARAIFAIYAYDGDAILKAVEAAGRAIVAAKIAEDAAAEAVAQTAIMNACITVLDMISEIQRSFGIPDEDEVAATEAAFAVDRVAREAEIAATHRVGGSAVY